MNKKLDGCQCSENFLSTTLGIILAGGIIGFFAAVLQFLGNPGNMGICVACFERDIAGALGFHSTSVVQYLRPEIMGMGLGACIAAMLTREWQARFGSAPLIRFLLGAIAAIGALIFLGCPWRALLRLAGGDLNALLGIAGLGTGIYIGTVFFRNGYSLGRSKPVKASFGYVFPVVLLALIALRFIFQPEPGESSSGILWYSLKGPGAQYAPPLISLAIGLAVGAIAQRSRFCTMGAFRDVFLFRQFHLFSGIASLAVAAFTTNMFLGQFSLGFESQPVAHTNYFWNFAGMLLAGLAFALAGGCPGRQIFAGGEGNVDAAIFALGVLFGAAIAHNFSLASSPTGIGANAPIAFVIGLIFCVGVGFFFKRK